MLPVHWLSDSSCRMLLIGINEGIILQTQDWQDIAGFQRKTSGFLFVDDLTQNFSGWKLRLHILDPYEQALEGISEGRNGFLFTLGGKTNWLSFLEFFNEYISLCRLDINRNTYKQLQILKAWVCTFYNHPWSVTWKWNSISNTSWTRQI